MKLKFIKTIETYEQCPPADRPEVMIAGRSNAGKSSLINAIAGSKVAYVSANPGRTVLLNFYDNRELRIVDSPGYGFSLSKQKKEGDLVVESYLSLRATLAGLILVMDVRRKWAPEEEMVIGMAQQRGLSWGVALTKCDKLNQKELHRQVTSIKKASGAESLFAVSSTKNKGIAEIEQFIFAHLAKKPV